MIVQRYRARSEGLAWRHVADEEIVVLDLSTSQYLTLNSTGALLWEALSDEARNKAELVKLLLEEFEVDEGTAETDVAEFVDKCLQENLLEITG